MKRKRIEIPVYDPSKIEEFSEEVISFYKKKRDIVTITNYSSNGRIQRASIEISEK